MSHDRRRESIEKCALGRFGNVVLAAPPKISRIDIRSSQNRVLIASLVRSESVKPRFAGVQRERLCEKSLARLRSSSVYVIRAELSPVAGVGRYLDGEIDGFQSGSPIDGCDGYGLVLRGMRITSHSRGGRRRNDGDHRASVRYGYRLRAHLGGDGLGRSTHFFTVFLEPDRRSPARRDDLPPLHERRPYGGRS